MKQTENGMIEKCNSNTLWQLENRKAKSHFP